MARTTLAITAAAALLAACGGGSQSGGDQPPELDSAGDPSWGSADIACSADSECADDEACIEGVCQMKRCTEDAYDSVPPIGLSERFFRDLEIVAAGGQGGAAETYAPDGDGVASAGASWDFGGGPIADLAGGRAAGPKAERVVAAVEGETSVRVGDRGGESSAIEVGFEPVAVALGDVDLDGIDEIAAASGGSRFALCRAEEATCEGYEFEDDLKGWDVTSADVDGDGYAEVVFAGGLPTGDLEEQFGGDPRLVIWNPHHEETEEPPRIRVTPKTGYPHIDAGDLDGDGVAELVGMNNSGPLGVLADKLHIYTWTGQSLGFASGREVGAKTTDLTAADLDMNGRDEVVVLRGDREAAVFRAGEDFSVVRDFSGTLSATSSPRRIAAVDLDGDSPTAELVEGPQTVPGPVVPIMALTFPPYAGDGAGTSSVSIGTQDRTTESYTDSVSLSVGVEFGVEAGIDGVLAGSVKSKISSKVQKSRGYKKREKVSTRFKVSAQPELYGERYGAVMLSSGCFHAYTYRIDDPADRVGGHDGKVVGLVPVDGRTTVWSTQRYNQLAAALGSVPPIEISSTIGDPSSYPSSPARLDGTPIPPEDMVFTDPPELLVSDIGDVGFKLSTEEYESQKTAMSTSLEVSASTNVAGVDLGGSVGLGTGQSYGITVGESVSFGGNVPPVVDDANSEDDEYVEGRFAYMPYVYKQPYTDAEGEPGAFYVMHYAVLDE